MDNGTPNGGAVAAPSAPQDYLEQAAYRVTHKVPLREVRVAVSMVGGSSLAIYENGVAQELFRMVHGQGIYGVIKRLTHSHAYIDILSGTSAGGINSIFLSAALTAGTDFCATSQSWVKLGDIDTLLQDPRSRDVRSLLRGQYHLQGLTKVFDYLTDTSKPISWAHLGEKPGIPSGQRTALELPADATDSEKARLLARQNRVIQAYTDLDLFVTGTYFQPQPETFFDARTEPIYNNNFAGVFNLKHRARRGESHFLPHLQDPASPPPPLIDPGDGVPWPGAKAHTPRRRLGVRDRLAYVARTTSSLPAIFETADVNRALMNGVITLPDGAEHNYMGDGGYLNKRPLDLVLREILNRPAHQEVVRKIFFVEPVAEELVEFRPDAPEPNAFAHLSFAGSVPALQNLSNSLETLYQHNKKARRVNETLDAAHEILSHHQPPSKEQHDLWVGICLQELRDQTVHLWEQELGLSNFGGVSTVRNPMEKLAQQRAVAEPLRVLRSHLLEFMEVNCSDIKAPLQPGFTKQAEFELIEVDLDYVRRKILRAVDEIYFALYPGAGSSIFQHIDQQGAAQKAVVQRVQARLLELYHLRDLAEMVAQNMGAVVKAIAGSPEYNKLADIMSQRGAERDAGREELATLWRLLVRCLRGLVQTSKSWQVRLPCDLNHVESETRRLEREQHTALNLHGVLDEKSGAYCTALRADPRDSKQQAIIESTDTENPSIVTQLNEYVDELVAFSVADLKSAYKAASERAPATENSASTSPPAASPRKRARPLEWAFKLIKQETAEQLAALSPTARDGLYREVSDHFRYLDMYLYPVERAAELECKDYLQLVQISARDVQIGLSRQDPQKKLGGDMLANLSAFLKSSWRANDILWGRLDASGGITETLLERERLVHLLNPGGTEKVDHEKVDPKAARRMLNVIENYILTGKVRNECSEDDQLPDPNEWDEIGAYLGPRYLQDQSAIRDWLNGGFKDDGLLPAEESPFQLLLGWLLRRHQLETIMHEVPGVLGEAIAEHAGWQGSQEADALPEPARNKKSSWLLEVSHLKDVDGLLRKLRDAQEAQDPLSVFLRQELPALGPRIEAHQDGVFPLRQLQQDLVEALNQVLRGESLYQKKRFAQVTLTAETKKLVKQKPQGEELVRLNRMLLEDAYPEAIVRIEESVTTAKARDMAKLLAQIHGNQADPPVRAAVTTAARGWATDLFSDGNKGLSPQKVDQYFTYHYAVGAETIPRDIPPLVLLRRALAVVLIGLHLISNSLSPGMESSPLGRTVQKVLTPVSAVLGAFYGFITVLAMGSAAAAAAHAFAWTIILAVAVGHLVFQIDMPRALYAIAGITLLFEALLWWFGPNPRGKLRRLLPKFVIGLLIVVPCYYMSYFLAGGRLELRHPLQAIAPDAGSAILAWMRMGAAGWILFGTVVLGVILTLIGPRMTDVMRMKWAGDAGKICELINDWGERDRLRAAVSLSLGFLWIAFYSTTVAFACLWAAATLDLKGISYGLASGVVLAWSAWVAGVFDFVANSALLTVLLYSGTRCRWLKAPTPLPGSSLLGVDDLQDAGGLVRRLRDASDPLSQYLKRQLALDLKHQLQAYKDGDTPTEALKKSLVDALNSIIGGELLYEKKRFARVRLTRKRRRMIAQEPRGEELIRLNRLLLEDAYPRKIARSLSFGVGDLKDARGLLRKLLADAPDPVSLHLQGKLAPHRIQQLQAHQEDAPTEALRKNLVDALNSIIGEELLYEKKRFAQVTLTAETKKLVKQKPQGEELIRLNRMLLEDAYPQEITRSLADEVGTHDPREAAEARWFVGALAAGARWSTVTKCILLAVALIYVFLVWCFGQPAARAATQASRSTMKKSRPQITPGATSKPLSRATEQPTLPANSSDTPRPPQITPSPTVPVTTGPGSRATPTPIVVPEDRFIRVADKLVKAINADDQKAIQALFAPVMRQALPEAKAGEFFRDLLRQSGKITKIGDPEITGSTARLRLTFERGAWEMRLSLDGQNLISGLLIVPPAPDIPVPARNIVPLRLPFREKWAVFWGGATVEQNYHVNTRNQRRALDLVMRDAKGQSHTGDGKRNEDYYCYGKAILAPAAGTVVTVIDGVPDNAPGSMNSFSAVGNCVIIQHAAHEFSVLAHLQPHTIRVKPGDRVQSGQDLGRCGNSGNSSEPHLHFHLQNTAVLQDGTGFAPYFQNVRVTRNGKTTVEQDYTPLRGDRIRSE